MHRFSKVIGFGALIVTTAALFWAPPAEAKPPKPPKKERRVVLVRGDQAWTNAGIRLRPQDRVTITATGKVCFSGNAPEACIDPVGWGVDDYPVAWEYDAQYCNDPEMGLNHAALLGEVAGDVFLVGKRSTFSGKDGALYLGVNDCTLRGGDLANSGEFSVVIVVERDAVPTS